MCGLDEFCVLLNKKSAHHPFGSSYHFFENIKEIFLIGKSTVYQIGFSHGKSRSLFSFQTVPFLDLDVAEMVECCDGCSPFPNRNGKEESSLKPPRSLPLNGGEDCPVLDGWHELEDRVLYGNPQEDRGMIWTPGEGTRVRVDACYVPRVPKVKRAQRPIRSAKPYLSPQWLAFVRSPHRFARPQRV